MIKMELLQPVVAHVLLVVSWRQIAPRVWAPWLCQVTNVLALVQVVR